MVLNQPKKTPTSSPVHPLVPVRKSNYLFTETEAPLFMYPALHRLNIKIMLTWLGRAAAAWFLTWVSTALYFLPFPCSSLLLWEFFIVHIPQFWQTVPLTIYARYSKPCVQFNSFTHLSLEEAKCGRSASCKRYDVLWQAWCFYRVCIRTYQSGSAGSSARHLTEDEFLWGARWR